tara:strand:- start:1584 stop:2096 length:513 start_codon:yes stop_codon:yes gene_type:complete
MLRANFFYRFFKQKPYNSNKITKYNSSKAYDIENRINSEILEIDQKISENSKNLFEAQIVKFRTTFSKSNNLIDTIGSNLYKAKLDDSINWHQKQIKGLYFRRKELQIDLEKIKGIFWLSRIKRFITFLLISFFIFFILFIFLSGFMIIIYLSPLIILILLGYAIHNRKY